MVGIGFELRRYLNEDSFTGTLKAYGFAGLIGAGPWVLSILGVMLIGLIGVASNVSGREVEQFTTSVTWLMGLSLILTGALQLLFTRFVADRLFERRDAIINPNLMGAIALTTLVSGVLGSLAVGLLFDTGFAYEVLMVANFVTLSNIWIVVIFVAGLRRFKLILTAFLVGYVATVGLSVLLFPYGLNGLLTGLLGGHALLLFLMLGLILREYPMPELVRFDFLERRLVFPILVVVGVCYNLGIWSDKFLFWLNPATSNPVIGPLRASLIYDLPIFMAYLSIIPGMAVFLLRIETDFAEAYDAFFRAVRGNASLQEIETLGNAMIRAVREGIYQIVKVQGLTVLILFLLGPRIIEWLGISPKFIHIYYVDLVGVAVQVLMLAVLNVLFYLDKLRDALLLTGTLVVTNIGFTWLSFMLGPVYYGYGFGVAMMVSAFLGVWLLARELENIEFHTFMRRRNRVPIVIPDEPRDPTGVAAETLR